MSKRPLSFAQNAQLRLALIAILLGALATLLVQAYVSRKVSTATGGAKVQVVSAAKLIPAGKPITEDDLVTKVVPLEYVSSKVIRGGELKSLIGIETKRTLATGEFVQWTDIKVDVRYSLSDYLKFNERAITLSVNNNNSFNNMLEPGDRIDVMTISTGGGLRGTPELKVLMQNVFIMAVDNNLQRALPVDPSKQSDGSKNISTITVKVSPEQAAKLAWASSQGSLHFMLRNRSNIFVEPMSPVGSVSNKTKDDDCDDCPDKGKKDLGLPTAVDGYPAIYEEGKFSRNGYFPSSEAGKAYLRTMDPKEFEKRVFDRLIDSQQ